MTAYQKGLKAKIDNATLQDCPYADNTRERKEWMQGFSAKNIQSKPIHTKGKGFWFRDIEKATPETPNK